MSDDHEDGHKVILPIHESEEEDSDISLDPELDEESGEEAPMSDDSEPHHLYLCQRCGAYDEDLIQWGSDEECFVCVGCHCCQECGANEPELIDHGNGQGYICIQCAERNDRMAMQQEDINANHEHANRAEVDDLMQQSANPHNPDPDATQWGVDHVSQGGPTSFMDMEK